MKPRTLIFSSVLLISFLGYQLWGSESVEISHPVVKSAKVEETNDKGTVEELEPHTPPKPSIGQKKYARDEAPQVEEASESPTPSEVPQEPMVNPETGIIKVKTPPEREGKPGIVNLVNNEAEAAPAEREKLDNVQASFSEGKDAVAVFGDALNALNGTYTGELQREGKEACPLTLVIDGLYTQAEGSKAADFTGNFVMQFECADEGHSKGTFDGQFGQHAKAIGENANTLVLKDGGDTYFQLSFSRDFQSVTGHAYRTPSGAQTRYAGKINAHR